MHKFIQSYEFILTNISKLTGKTNFYFKPIQPKLSDKKLISLIILAEFKSIDTEPQLFTELSGT